MALLRSGAVAGFGRGHLGQLTGGTRGPHTVRPGYSYALSKSRPVAVAAHGDCSCVLAAEGTRGRSFGDSSRCFGKCAPGAVAEMMEAMRSSVALSAASGAAE